MTDRDRLIELLFKCDKDNDVLSCFNERPRQKQSAEIIADYLIANGVILPPCKVGDKVYRPAKYLGIVQFVITSFNMYQSEMFFTDDSDNIIYIPDIGKTVFLTREEAEKALKESAHNG